MHLADDHITMIKNNSLKQAEIKIPHTFTTRRATNIAVSLCNSNNALKRLNWKANHDLYQSIFNLKNTWML